MFSNLTSNRLLYQHLRSMSTFQPVIMLSLPYRGYHMQLAKLQERLNTIVEHRYKI
jgi:hypothetical protein